MNYHKHQPFRFVNWARNVRGQAECLFRPADELEVKDILKSAQLLRKKVRCVGSGHSWSRLAFSKEWMISLDRMKNILHWDAGRGLLTVQGGTTLEAINGFLDRQGYALKILGSISKQTISGLISTGTHGSNLALSILAHQVHSLRIVRAGGEVISVNVEEDNEIWPAVGLSLGLLGVITEVTLQCVKAFHLEEERTTISFEEAIRLIPQLGPDHQYIKFWWIPHTDKVVVFQAYFTDKKRKVTSWSNHFFQKWGLERLFFSFFLNLGRIFPALIIPINRFLATYGFPRSHRVDKGQAILNLPMPPRHRETEWAIDWRKTPEALRRIQQLIEKEKLRINFVFEIRFVCGDDFWLSPAYGRTSTYLGAYYCGKRGWEEYLHAFGKLMLELDGRPHWGKEIHTYQLPWASMYPNWKQFWDLRKQWDPQDSFCRASINSLSNLDHLEIESAYESE